jgi:hypothetical protein
MVCTVFAPIKRSEAFLVVTESPLVVVLFPVELTTTSTGLSGSIPLYSRILMSGECAADAKLTVTVFVPAAAALMFFA